jgi:ABC-type branched-subunit amino acid transport system substrate-binding protein
MVVNTITFNSDEKDYTMLVKQISVDSIDGLVFIPQTDDTAKGVFTAIMKDPLQISSFQ